MKKNVNDKKCNNCIFYMKKTDICTGLTYELCNKNKELPYDILCFNQRDDNFGRCGYSGRYFVKLTLKERIVRFFEDIYF